MEKMVVLFFWVHCLTHIRSAHQAGSPRILLSVSHTITLCSPAIIPGQQLVDRKPVRKGILIAQVEPTYSTDSHAFAQPASQQNLPTSDEKPLSWSEPLRMLLKNFFVIGFGLILMLAFFLYQAFEEKKHVNKLLQIKNEEIESQNEEIEKQKKFLEEKHAILQKALFEIEQQKKELETYNATKDKFFSIIAHDLKSPLNSLQGFSALLMACAESLTLDDIKSVATKLNEQIKNTVLLTDNLLTWARLQMNHEEFFVEVLSLPEMVEENVTLLEPIASLKEIRLQTDVSSLFVMANAGQLKFILRNLLANAIKFSYTQSRIRIEAHQNANMIEISVVDEGIGMDQATIDSLFRVDAHHRGVGTVGERGTGLGLILCKEFVEKNKGQLWVKSREKEGSTFIFSLPLGASTLA